MSVKQLFDLTGQVALITGGSRGLGLQMAEALGEMGARIAIAARKPHELAAAEAALTAKGIEVFSVPCDLGDIAAKPAERLTTAVLERFGRIDILINNAGASWGAPAEDHPAEAWRKVMTLNVDAAFYLAQEVGKRAMIPQGGGRIVNIASVAGLGGNPPNLNMFTIAYNTSKGAMVNFTRALAAEWGRYNINVNAICPGFFPSKMSQGLLDRFDKEVLAATPLGRLGGDEDLKGAAVFFASAASRHVTGQILAVDGGSAVV
jgi:gluconate 5-dehydrogenase